MAVLEVGHPPPVPPLQLGGQSRSPHVHEQRSHSTPSAPGRVASRVNSRGDSRGYISEEQARIDRLVNEQLTDCLTDRTNFRNRTENVHNNGELTWDERLKVAARAVWAVPLVWIGKGVQASGVVACSRIVRSSPTVVREDDDDDDVAPSPAAPFKPTAPGKEVDPPSPKGGQVPAFPRRNDDLDSEVFGGGFTSSSDFPANSQSQFQFGASERELAQAPSSPKGGKGGKGGKKGRRMEGDQSSAISVSSGMTSSAAALLGPMATSKGQGKGVGVNRRKNREDDSASILSTQQNPQSAAASALGPMMQPGGARRQKPRGEGASVLDLQQNPQSSAASVLGALSQPGGSQRPRRRDAGETGSVLDAPPAQSQAASLLGGMSQPGGQRPRQGSPQRGAGTGIDDGQARPKAPRAKPDAAGRSVISSSSALNSGSNAASLLGPMLGNRGKGGPKGKGGGMAPQSIPE